MAKQIKLKSDESGALLPPDDDSFGNDKPNDSISAELGVDPDEPEDSEEEKEEMYGWALKAYSHDLERWQPQFQQIQDDLKFLAREHWPQSVIQARGPEKPTPVYDLTGSMVNKVANEARANPPGIIIRRLDDSENNEVADILQGHVRAIEDHSRATIAYEEAMRMTASCGYGVIAVEIEEEEGSFESEIKISKVDDVCSVVFDSDLTSEHDANHVFWLRSYSKDRAIEEFGEDCIPGPGITPVEYLKQWQKGDLVYIAQVWRKVSEPDTLLELVSDLDGSKKAIWATDMAKEPERYAGYKIGRRKDGNKPVVKYGIMSGRKMLHLQDWPGAKIPLVPVFGNRDQTSLGTMYSGLVRLMMDPNREYNYIKAQEIMAIAQAPQTPWIVARGSIDQTRLDWNYLNVSPKPYAEYESWDSVHNCAYPAPTRQTFNVDTSGLLASQAAILETIGRITGVTDANIGEQTNDISGRAITARIKLSDALNFHYYSNLQRSVEQVGRIVLDLCRKTYKAGKKARVIDAKGKESQKVLADQTIVNPQTGVTDVYDIVSGEYGVTIHAGPSYATKREEAAAAMTDFLKFIPEDMKKNVMDLFASYQDWPDIDILQTRLEKMVDPAFRTVEGQGEADPAATQILDQYGKEMEAQQQLHAETLSQLQQAMSTINELKGIIDGQSAQAAATVQAAEIRASGQIQVERIKGGNNLAKTKIEVDADNIALQASNFNDMRQKLIEHAIELANRYVDQGVPAQGIAGTPGPDPMAVTPASTDSSQGGGAQLAPQVTAVPGGTPVVAPVPRQSGI